MKALGLDLGLLLSQAVNLPCWPFCSTSSLYKPVLGKLEERARRIKKGVKDASTPRNGLPRQRPTTMQRWSAPVRKHAR